MYVCNSRCLYVYKNIYIRNINKNRSDRSGWSVYVWLNYDGNYYSEGRTGLTTLPPQPLHPPIGPTTSSSPLCAADAFESRACIICSSGSRSSQPATISFTDIEWGTTVATRGTSSVEGCVCVCVVRRRCVNKTINPKIVSPS